MFSDLPWFVYVIVGVSVLAMIIDAVQRPKRRRKRLEQIAALRVQAEARGWSVDYDMQYQSAQLTFRGRESGVTWELQSQVMTSRGGRLESGGTTRSRSVWRSDDGRIAAGHLLVIWPAFGQADVVQAGTGAAQMFVDLLVSPLISALGSERVNRQLFTRAQPYEAERLAGAYLLRTTDAELMRRFLAAGALEALDRVRDWLGARDAENHLVVGVVSEAGVTLLLEGWIEDLERVAKLAATGAALVQAAAAVQSSS